MEEVLNVLFLSQRDSARGVMAEALLNHFGRGKFHAVSAGVRPAENVDPIARELLEHAKVPYDDLKPKHYKEFASNAHAFDFVFTLSDTAAGEPLPVWPGQPITAHWRSADPMKIAEEGERRRALMAVRAELERRIRLFINLPFESLDRMSLQSHVDELGSAGR